MSVFDDPTTYPAIVLHQPYAGLVRLAGLGFDGKTIETRKTRIAYRGLLVFSASQNPDWLAMGRIGVRVAPVGPSRDAFEHAVRHRGMVLAIADVVDCRQLMPDDEPRSWFYEPGRFAWILENIRPIKPFIAKGAHQGFYAISRTEIDARIEVTHGS